MIELLTVFNVFVVFYFAVLNGTYMILSLAEFEDDKTPLFVVGEVSSRRPQIAASGPRRPPRARGRGARCRASPPPGPSPPALQIPRW